MKTFSDFLTGTLLRPGRTFDLLMKDDRRLELGFTAITVNAILYTLIYEFLTIGGGARSAFSP